MNAHDSSLDPSFFVLGAQKAGTTTLHSRLQMYPEISLPKNKETHFFSDSDKFKRGFNWYLGQFPELKLGGIRGEVAPQYMYCEKAAERISSIIPTPRLVFMLRHPIDRAHSNYLMSVRQGMERHSFLEALELEEERLKAGGDTAKNYFSYMARGEYSKQIIRFKNYFPTSPMHFVLFEDFVDTGTIGEKTYSDIVSFLGLDYYISPDFSAKENVASEPRSAWLRNFLYGSSVMKKQLGKIIPNQDIRERIAHTLDKLNQKPKRSELQVVPDFVLEWCNQEIKLLSELLGINLQHWCAITDHYKTLQK